MRMLITGGSGFVGLAIAHAASETANTVAIFANRAPPAKLSEMAGDKIQVHIGDITNPADVTQCFERFRPTHVVHAAALTPAPDRETEVAARLIAVNIEGTAVALCAAAAARVRRVVVLSSIGAYGPVDISEGPIDEARPANPTNLYGISKWSAERVAGRLAGLLGVELVIARLSSVYGPFEYESGDRDVMSPHLQMLRAARAGVAARLTGTLRADWIYSRDVAAAILTASERDELGGQTFNIGGGVVTDLLDWGALLTQRFTSWRFGICEAGQSPNVFYRSERETAALNINRFAAAAAFRPSFDQPRAAADFVAWFDRYQTAP
jgi:UDP-glucose 4-epimerase